VEVATDGPKRAYTLTGTLNFGTQASLGGAQIVAFDLPTAQVLFDKRGKIDGALVAAAEGTTPEELARAVRGVLPAGAQVRTSAQEVERQLADLGEGLSFLTSALLAFGFIAVLVGGFIIFNTFSITVAQRLRELALLRTLGATRRQVLGTILAEAALIGILASLAGLAAGYGFAIAINALFEAIGIDLPSTSPVLLARTVVVALLVGVVVTMAGALVPALRATRVAPVEALREAAVPTVDRRRRAVTVLAVLATAAGAALVAVSLLGNGDDADARVAGAGGGAVLLVLGIALLSPRLVRPAARLVGAPLERSTHLVGRLARENAARNPGRTAVTASALMIGLALVLFVTIFANGLRSSFDDVVERQFAGDLAVLHDDGFSDIPARTADAAARVPGVRALTRVKGTPTRLEGGAGTVFTSGIEPDTFGSIYRFDWVERGDPAAGALLETGLADARGLEVGERITLTGTAGRRLELPVAGTYRDSGLLGDIAIPLDDLQRISSGDRLSVVLVDVRPGADLAEVQGGVARALEPFPEARARDQDELKEENGERVNQLLSLFYALLALSLLISAFGIVNTLTLAVHERTRELGVLRAVGMTRREVRRLVRYESVITALLGAALGLVLGLFFAFVVTRALADEGIGFSVPVGQVLVFVAFATLLGVLAAILPARRASRLDVVAAVSYE
jgi:putative ABC transport system permease protein